MGFLKSIFSGRNDDAKKEESQISWIPLTDSKQLEAIERKSASRPQLIFKHSTTCGVSRMVLNLLEKNPLLQEDRFDLYFLDLHRYRGVSNEAAQRFGVLHQSPQLLVLKDRQTVAHASHGGIPEISLEEFL